MKTNTIRYLDDGTIELIDIAIGDPGGNEVQLQGGACGICSWDIVTAKLDNKMSPMAPPGHEGVGIGATPYSCPDKFSPSRKGFYGLSLTSKPGTPSWKGVDKPFLDTCI